MISMKRLLSASLLPLLTLAQESETIIPKNCFARSNFAHGPDDRNEEKYSHIGQLLDGTFTESMRVAKITGCVNVIERFVGVDI